MIHAYLFRWRATWLLLAGLLLGWFAPQAWAQTPYSLSAGPYAENFDNIGSWTADFGAGTGANRFSKAFAQPTLPNTNNVFTTGTAGGVQKGTNDALGKIVLLATGTTDGQNAAAFDLNLDFSNATAGTISLDWASVNNSTGDRRSTFKLQTNTGANGVFVDLPHPAVVVANNVPTSGALNNIALPAAFSNNAGAKIRFFLVTSGGGTTGSRPKISIDNLRVTAGSPDGGPAASIGAAGVQATSFCVTATAASSSFAVTFSSTGSFAEAFGVQLSDANGNFPQNTTSNLIGTGAASPITAAIPANTPSGAGYRVRVVNGSPATYGPGNGSNLGVALAPASNGVTVAPAAEQIIVGSNLGTSLTSTATAPSAFAWYYATSAAGPFDNSIAGATGAAYQPKGSDFGAAGTYYVVAKATSTCGNVEGQSMPVTIRVMNSMPVITTSLAAVPAFGSVAVGAAANAQSFTVSGEGLTSNLLLAPPAGFEIRTGNQPFACCTISLAPTNGTVNPTTVEVRLAPTAAQAYQAAIAVSSTGAADQAVAVSGSGTEPIYPATVGTAAVTNLAPTSASAGGSITTDGGSAVAARGVVWGTAPNPALGTSQTSDGTGSGEFTSVITGLLPGTTYYVRAYATNTAGTTYGDELTFTTPAVPLADEPTAAAQLVASQVTTNSLQLTISGGNGAKHLVLARLGAPVDATPEDAKTYLADAAFGKGNQVGAGNFVVYGGSNNTLTVTDLRPNTAYYFAVFEYNDNGTPYAENYLTSAKGEVAATTQPVPAKLLLEENFVYTAGSLLTANNWAAHSGTAAPVAVATGSLAYPNYGASNLGNSAAIVANGQDVNRSFETTYARTPVYTAFLVKVNNASSTADYFLHLGASTLGTNFRARVFVRKNTATNKVQFGVSGSSSTVVYAPAEYDLGTTHLLVLKYTFDETSNETKLFINPAANVEPATANATATEAGSTSLSDIGTVALRQGTNSPNLLIDGIRVGNTYRVVKTGLTCEQPAPAFSATTACAGTATTFTDASASIQADAVYGWDVNNDGQVDYTTKGNIEHTYAVAGTYTAKLTITQGQCSDTYTQTVTVNGLPELAALHNLTATSKADDCGASVAFAAAATGTPAPEVTFSAVLNGVPTPISSPYFFPVGTTTVTATATNGCGSVSKTFAVTVTDETAPTVRTRNLTVTLVNGAATITAEQISNGSSDACGIATLALDNSSFDCANLGPNTVTLTVTDVHGNQASAQATVTVTGTIPEFTISVTPATPVYTGGVATNLYLGYGPQRVTLAATGGVRYTWSPATGLSDASAANPTFTATAPGTFTYTVTAYSASGCTATKQVTLTVLDVRCGNKNDKVLVCHNGKALCLDAQGAADHLAHGDKLGDCRTQAAPTASPNTAALVAGSTPASTAKGEQVFEAFPNPFAEQTVVRVRTTEASRAQLQLYNSLGQLVATLFEGTAEAGRTYEFTVQGASLAPGVYTCRLALNGKVEVKRLIVAK
ncbi:T9SS type A sorting domain-containing protein [Hymenobacter oligotrophus]|nr:T9SS type A sorting domain-containing protein [Hymenobacter oligotrophus]